MASASVLQRCPAPVTAFRSGAQSLSSVRAFRAVPLQAAVPRPAVRPQQLTCSVVAKAAAAAAAEVAAPEAVAHLRYVRSSPLKVRRVLDQIRGRNYEEAIMILEYMPYKACETVLKVLLSAGANAKNNLGLRKKYLVVSEATADGGPVLKRAQPRAQGRAYPIKKPLVSISIKLREDDKLKGGESARLRTMAKLWIGNLPPGIPERDVEIARRRIFACSLSQAGTGLKRAQHACPPPKTQDAFLKFGQLRNVWVARKPPGFGFVEFEDRRDAEDAVRELDGHKGWRVEFSRSTGGPKIGGGPAGGGGGGGYRERSPPRRRSPSPRRRRSPSYDRGGGRDDRRRSRSRSRGGRSRRSPSYDRGGRDERERDGRRRRRSRSRSRSGGRDRRRDYSPPPRRGRSGSPRERSPRD
eukprot:scaffold30.g4427.t1